MGSEDMVVWGVTLSSASTSVKEESVSGESTLIRQLA